MLRLLFIFSLFLTFTSCKNEAAKSQNQVKVEKDPFAPTNVSDSLADNPVNAVNINKVTVQEAKNLVKNKGYRFLDIRTPGEIERGKIEGALEISIKTYDFQHRIDKLDRNAKLIIYDSAGNRSALAAKLFSILEFSNVVEMPGGYSAWTEAHKKQNN